jgi:hypothetical protein
LRPQQARAYFFRRSGAAHREYGELQLTLSLGLE